MGLLESITKLEQEENLEKCCKCESYRNWDEMGRCVFFDCDTMPDDCCRNFVLSKFWETKRGYV